MCIAPTTIETDAPLTAELTPSPRTVKTSYAASGASHPPLTTAALETSTLWRAAGQGLERGGLAAAALAGALTFCTIHMFGLIPDALIGALLVGLLASAIIGLTGLLWKGLRLPVLLGGRLASTKLGDKALLPAAWMRSVRGEPFGAILAMGLLVVIDQTEVPGANSIKLFAPGELIAPFVMVAAVLLSVAFSGRPASRAMRPGIERLIVVVAVVAVATPICWLLYRGYDGYLARPDTGSDRDASAYVPKLSLENPALPGAYDVRSLSYGSGRDKHRREYGRGADLITPSVDAKAAWTGYSGITESFYRWWYGFDTTALPLNGLVWYPHGDGPFPIVLVVHGNHTAGDYSDPGYAYLGEHLASRGFITVSVDENFLNGWFFYDGLGKEMPVRAWLLLKHLQEWREWNEEPGNIFYHKVDLKQVALIGHSRGGEAAAHAAAMNQRFYAPIDSVAEKGEFGFGIKAVVGIAPPDGQYRPGGRAETLKDVSYLALYGGHDQDLWWAAPVQQYNRVEFETDRNAFKAVAYVYRANHGQFNTVWGDADYGPINSLMLNRKPLLSGEEQRVAGKLYMTAFLEAALAGRAEHREVFKNPAATRQWLPEDIYVTQYEDATFQAVNTNERLTKAGRIDVVDGEARWDGFTLARRVPLPLRNGEKQGSSAMLLEWEAGSNPTYTIELPTGGEAGWKVTDTQALAFAFGNATDTDAPMEVTVELQDDRGTRVSLPLRQFGLIPPPLGAHMLKSEPLSRALNVDYYRKMTSHYERMLQTYILPLADFVAEDPGLDIANIAAIRFCVDGARSGKAYIDQVGFTG